MRWHRLRLLYMALRHKQLAVHKIRPQLFRIHVLLPRPVCISRCMVHTTNTKNTKTMETKEYIGHGKKHSEWDVIDVVLDADKLMEHCFSYEGKRYLKISVAARKSKSQYGSTHSVYVRPKADAPAAAEPAPKPKRRKKAQAQ